MSFYFSSLFFRKNDKPLRMNLPSVILQSVVTLIWNIVPHWILLYCRRDVMWLMVLSYLVICRAHSRFTHCPMIQGCQLHPASSKSFLRADLRSAWSEFMWCAVLTCSLRIQMAWWVLNEAATEQPPWFSNKELNDNHSLNFIWWKRWWKLLKLRSFLCIFILVWPIH